LLPKLRPASTVKQKGGVPKGAAKFGGETSRSEMAEAICRSQQIGALLPMSSSQLRAPLNYGSIKFTMKKTQ
jgi:hypothetical protein